MSAGRVLIYVQHLLGIGHVSRSAAMVRALRAYGLDVTYAAGGVDNLAVDLAGAEMLRLPPARARDASFRGLVDENGRALGEPWRQRRRRMLLDAFERTDPDVLVIETFPFGRWPFRFELLPLLRLAHGRARIVCSVRDILVEKREPDRLRAIVDLVRRYFDRVLVHGDPALAVFDATFASASRIADRLVYTGYVAAPGAVPGYKEGEGTGEIVVSAGGGATGGPLMRAAAAAALRDPKKGRVWRLLLGPNLDPATRAALTPRPGLIVEPIRTDFWSLLARCAVSVSQAGYNTVVDALTARARSVLVPFEGFGQTEQGVRARLLEARGLATVLPMERLTPGRLLATVERAARLPRPDPGNLDFRGAEAAANVIADLATRARRGRSLAL